MIIDILICTYNEGIKKVSNILLRQQKGLHYTISHQYTDERYMHIPDVLKREDIYINQISGRGLSINRNNCIKHAIGEICFIADDDVKYTQSYIDNVKAIFLKNPLIDILIGKIETNTDKAYKKYGETPKRLNILNASRISSIEIVFRRANIIKYNIKFDERFGLGSTLFPYGGEEFIFISDCLNRKLHVNYFPITIVEHPYESSGKMTLKDELFVQYHAAQLNRVFGRVAFFLLPVLFLKNYIGFISLREFIRNSIIGFKKLNNSIRFSIF